MRVCLLSKMFPPGVGGSELYAYELANALSRLGHDVDVYTQQRPGPGDAFTLEENVSVETVSKPRKQLVTFETLYYSLRARRAVDFENYDVVHGTLMPASTIAIAPRFDHDVPIVVTSHSFAPMEVRAHSPEAPADVLLKFFFHPMNAVMDAVTARSVDHVIAISSEMKRQIAKAYRVDPERISVISHGVDTERFRPRDRPHEAVDPEAFTVLFVGRLISRKGADLAIRALAATDDESIELLVAGTGRQRPKLESMVHELGVSDRVRFLGYVEESELPRLYSSADVTLFLSNYEGFGLVFMESMASGTPIVGTPVGGIPDIVKDGETGYIESGDPDRIAARLRHLKDDPEEHDRISDAAYETATRMDWRCVGREVQSLYERVI